MSWEGKAQTTANGFIVEGRGRQPSDYVHYFPSAHATSGMGLPRPCRQGDHRSGLGYKAVKVLPIDDNKKEPNETVILTIKPNPAYIVGTPSSARVTIKDDD